MSSAFFFAFSFVRSFSHSNSHCLTSVELVISPPLINLSRIIKPFLFPFWLFKRASFVLPFAKMWDSRQTDFLIELVIKRNWMSKKQKRLKQLEIVGIEQTLVIVSAYTKRPLFCKSGVYAWAAHTSGWECLFGVTSAMSIANNSTIEVKIQTCIKFSCELIFV